MLTLPMLTISESHGFYLQLHDYSCYRFKIALAVISAPRMLIFSLTAVSTSTTNPTISNWFGRFLIGTKAQDVVAFVACVPWNLIAKRGQNRHGGIKFPSRCILLFRFFMVVLELERHSSGRDSYPAVVLSGAGERRKWNWSSLLLL